MVFLKQYRTAILKARTAIKHCLTSPSTVTAPCDPDGFSRAHALAPSVPLAGPLVAVVTARGERRLRVQAGQGVTGKGSVALFIFVSLSS
jgi:hypothetical protein